MLTARGVRLPPRPSHPQIWDVRSPGNPVQAYTTDGENMNVAYSPDGRYMAMGWVQPRPRHASLARFVRVVAATADVSCCFRSCREEDSVGARGDRVDAMGTL